MTGQAPPLTVGQRLLGIAQSEGIPSQLSTKLNTEWSRDNPDEGWLGAGLGTVAAVGKGVVEGGLRLARGAQWLTDLTNPYSPLGSKTVGQIPTDVRDILPQAQALKLESRLSQAPFRKTSEFLGDVLTMVASGGTSGAVGKVAGAPGSVVNVLSAPVAKLGQYVLEQSPNLGRWSKLAEHLPSILGTSSGFGLYNFLTTEGDLDKRAGALAHGMVSGAAISVFGKLANAVEGKILSRSTSMAEKRAFNGMREQMSMGKAGELVRRLDATIVGSAIEGTGFASLDKQFWSDVIDGVRGDGKAMGRAMETWAGSTIAVLLARTGRPDAHMVFRREMPELNTLDTRLIAESIRQPPKQAPAPPQGPQDPVQGPKGTPVRQQWETADEAVWRLPVLNRVSDPLFKSGWDLKPGIDQQDGRIGIEMQFPGSGTVRMWENEGQAGPAAEAFEIEVPVDVFRVVRGKIEVPEGTENIRMVGQVAEEFTRDLAAVSILRRIRGDLLFGHNGEAWAGGPWRSPDGLYDTIGLDGAYYKQGLFPEDGFTKQEGAPALPPENGARENPQIARWLELAQDLRDNTAQNPGLDLLEASLMLAIRGSPNSRSVLELQRLLAEEWQPGSGVMNADLAANVLRPDTIEQFGLTVGQVAAGHLTAEQAAMQLGTVLMGPSKGTQLPAPVEGQPSGQELSQKPPAGTERDKPGQAGTIAGTRDWFGSSTPQERREAARAYAEQNPKATPAMLRDTFGVPRETARDILKGRDPESGSVPSEVLAAPVKALGEFVQDVGAVAKSLYEYSIPDSVRLLETKGGEAGKRLATEFRDIQSQTRTNLGAANKPIREGSKALGKMYHKLKKPVTIKTKDGVEFKVPMWIAATEGKLNLKSKRANEAAQALNDSLLALHEAFRQAGGFMFGVDRQTGKPRYFKPGERDRAVVARVYSSKKGKSLRDVLANDALRKEWFDDLAKLNQDMVVEGRPVTGADFEGWFQEAQGAKKVENPEKVAAFEQVRYVKNMPGEWRGHEILEPDPMVAMHRIMQQQAARAAAIKTVGQELPAKVREQFGDTRPGMSNRLQQFRAEMRAEGIPADRQQQLDKLATTLAERLQGREPDPIGPGMRAWEALVVVPRAMFVVLSGVRDIPAMFVEPMVSVGYRRAFRAIIEALWSPVESGRLAEDVGSMMHEVGNLDMGIANTPLKKIASIVLWPSNALERIKQTIFDRAADIALRDWAKGKTHAGDTTMLTKILHMTEQEAASLMNNTATPEVMAKFRHGLVQTLASRGRFTERSQLSSSPFWRAMIWYTGYATKRAQLIVDEAAAFKDALSPNSKMPAGERAAVVKNYMTRWIGTSVGGLGGLLFAYMLSELFRGRNGYERFERELANYPHKTVIKETVNQMLSGPLAVVSSSVSEDPKNLFRIAAPLNLIASGMEQAMRSGTPFERIQWVSERMGYWSPHLSATFATLQAAYTGTKGFEKQLDTVRQWERLEGIKTPFGTPDKQPEFYAAMRSVWAALKTHEGTIDQLWPKVEQQMKDALDLQPEQTIADKIRSMRMLANRSLEQKDKLLAFMGKKEFKKVIEHDNLLMQLSEMVGKMQGTEPMQWTDALDMSSRLADAGTPNAWGKVMDRAIDQAAQEMKGGNFNDHPYLLQLALRIASQPLSIDNESAFSKDDRKWLSGLDYNDAAYQMERIFYERAARQYASKERKEAIDEMEKEQIK